MLVGYSGLFEENIRYLHIPFDAVYGSLVPIGFQSIAIEREPTRTALRKSVPRIGIEEIPQLPNVALSKLEPFTSQIGGMDRTIARTEGSRKMKRCLTRAWRRQ